MNTDRVVQDCLLVDGQQMVAPNSAAWDSIIREGSFDTLPVYYAQTKHIVDELLRFTKYHADEFKLGLCKDGPYANVWSVVCLFRTDDGWQRVHVEQVQCAGCGQQWTIANPTVTELYLGVPQKWDSLARAFARERVRCRQCGSDLPRFGIWAESFRVTGHE
jgi:hypothetical protein